MIRQTHERRILGRIIQNIIKYSNYLLISYTNNYIYKLIYFLWKIGIIYGFKTINNHTNIIFLKITKKLIMSSLILLKNKHMSYTQLYKKYTWDKNKILILSSIKGLTLNIDLIKKRIGGFLLLDV